MESFRNKRCGMPIASASKWQRLRREFSVWARRRSSSRVVSKADLTTVARLDASEQKEFDDLLGQYRTVDSLLDWPEERSAKPDAPLFSEGQMLAGRFKIIRFIGRGGMGEVYEARNTTLHDSPVALKTLSAEERQRPGATRRFMVEVELAQRVTHPNICRIHDIYPFTLTEAGGIEVHGHFLTMHLLEGESLAHYIARRGSIPLSEAIPLLRTMAAALAAAHDAGVIHRDFKPGNVILIERRGALEPVITDFGLASLAERAAEGETGTALSFFTRAGTPEYSAPEQLHDGCVSPASDIYSLGVVALEMLTGQTVDVGARPLPQAVYAAIQRCLDPNPSARFATAPEFVAALAGERIAVPQKRALVSRRKALAGLAGVSAAAAVALFERHAFVAPSINSLAILPFVLADSKSAIPGFEEELVRTFLKSRKVRLMAPYSALSIQVPSDFKKLEKLIPADGYLTGLISQKAVMVRLLTRKGAQLWKSEFSRSKSQFDLNREIEQSVMKEIVGAQEAEFISTPTYVPTEEGYRAFIKARMVMQSHTGDELRDAEALFRETIRHDASFSLAFSGLAYTLFLMGRMTEARSAVDRALQLDPNSAEAHFVHGFLLYRSEWNWEGALSAFKRAVDLEPYNGATHQAYGGCLADLGRFGLGIPELRTAVEFDPLSYNAKIGLGVESLYARDYEEAKVQLEHAIAQAQEQRLNMARPYPFLGATWLMKGDKEAAYYYYLQALKIEPQSPQILAHYVFGAAQTGHISDAKRKMAQLLRMLDSSSAYFYTGLAFAGVGERSNALDFLDRAVEVKDPDAVLMKVHLYLDSLRSEPRYISILRRMNLV